MGGEGKSFEIESGRREIFCERVNPPYDREDPPPTRLIGAHAMGGFFFLKL
jgi:hypothetical protein